MKCELCKNKAYYGYYYLNAIRCSMCKKNDMINVLSKKCILCKKKCPNFNIEGEKQALYCADCKKEDMIDIRRKKCIVSIPSTLIH